MNDEEADTENTRLYFVFTKSFIPYINSKNNSTDQEDIYSMETTEKDIFSWINSIEPDQKRIKYFSYFTSK